MVFCSLIASSAIRAFISALKLRRCLDFISAPFPRQRFYTLLTGPNFGEHLSQPSARIPLSASRPPCRVPRTILFVLTVPINVPRELASPSRASEADEEVVNSAAESPVLLVFGNHVRGWIPGRRLLY